MFGLFARDEGSWNGFQSYSAYHISVRCFYECFGVMLSRTAILSRVAVEFNWFAVWSTAFASCVAPLTSPDCTSWLNWLLLPTVSSVKSLVSSLGVGVTWERNDITHLSLSTNSFFGIIFLREREGVQSAKVSPVPPLCILARSYPPRLIFGVQSRRTQD